MFLGPSPFDLNPIDLPIELYCPVFSCLVYSLLFENVRWFRQLCYQANDIEVFCLNKNCAINNTSLNRRGFQCGFCQSIKARHQSTRLFMSVFLKMCAALYKDRLYQNVLAYPSIHACTTAQLPVSCFTWQQFSCSVVGGNLWRVFH